MIVWVFQAGKRDEWLRLPADLSLGISGLRTATMLIAGAGTIRHLATNPAGRAAEAPAAGGTNQGKAARSIDTTLGNQPGNILARHPKPEGNISIIPSLTGERPDFIDTTLGNQFNPHISIIPRKHLKFGILPADIVGMRLIYDGQCEQVSDIMDAFRAIAWLDIRGIPYKLIDSQGFVVLYCSRVTKA